MRIGVVSDTHSRELPKQMLEDFKAVDLIVHAGDFCSVDVLDQFKKLKKEIRAVYGNMDDGQVRGLLHRVEVFPCERYAIGLFHGSGPPRGLLDVVKKEFGDRKVDVVIFGHSHHPMNEVINGVLYFNPGSPNDEIFAPYCSYGIIELSDQIEGKIIKVRS